MALSWILWLVRTAFVVTVPTLAFSGFSKINDIDKPIPVDEATVVEGSVARLECDLRPSRPEDSAYLVLWYLETQKQPIYSVDLRARLVHQAKHWADERLANRSEFSMVDPAALIFYNVSQSDAGVYRCRVDFRHSPTRHVRYKLNVVRLPRVPVIFGNDAREFGDLAGPFDEGSDLTLNCEFSADSTSTLVHVAWFQHDLELDSRIEYLARGVILNRLILYNLDRSHHNTTYTCSAKLLAVPSIPAASKSVTVSVRMRPSSVEISVPGLGFLEAGKSQEIHCRSTGANPAALITWWAGNRQLTHSITSVPEDGNGTLSTLRIIAAMEDDGRVLTCRAHTPHLLGGAIEDSWRMHVYYPPRVSLSLGRQFLAEEIREGGDIYLECHIRANPTIHRLTWLQNGLSVSEQRSGGQVLFVNQTLVLRQVGRHSAGNYSCVAANRQGETTSESLFVHVKYSPVCRRSTIRTVGMSLKQTATLRCQIDADPPQVTFRWTLATAKGTNLVPRETTTEAGLTSVLEHTPRTDADFGQLYCWAKNSIGTQKDPCVFEIVKEGLPPPPSDCKLLITADSILEVKCSSSDTSVTGSSDDVINDVTLSGPRLPQYALELYDTDTGRLLRNVTNQIPRFRLANVDPATRVAAVVSALNGQGRSERVTIEGAVQRAVGSREANEADSTLSIALLLALPGVLLLAVVVLAALLAALHRKRKQSRRQDSQPPGNDDIVLANTGQPDLLQPKKDDMKDTAVTKDTKTANGEADHDVKNSSKFSPRLSTHQYLV